MTILGIETSCDETAAAILERKNGRIHILSNIVASSASLQAKYGGIIPEQAAREQIKSIIPVIETAIKDSGLMIKDIDAIAVTQGPGLIGSLLVGVETAKTLSLIWDKPLIAINHLIGHFYANWITVPAGPVAPQPHPMSSTSLRAVDGAPRSAPPANQTPKFPCLGLLVSGGHTDLVIFQNHGKYEYLGGTRDDAAGECFDKCARLLGLPYPGGPQISKLALKGKSNKFKLPLPMQGDKSGDFSYSGLKTAVARIVNSGQVTDDNKADLALSLEETIVKSLIEKVVLASKKYAIDQIMVAGGVAANQRLTNQFRQIMPEKTIFIPPPYLCTDNGAMIASAAFFEKQRVDPLKLQADPSLSLAG